jgi:hypothetical protein
MNDRGESGGRVHPHHVAGVVVRQRAACRRRRRSGRRRCCPASPTRSSTSARRQSRRDGGRRRHRRIRRRRGRLRSFEIGMPNGAGFVLHLASTAALPGSARTAGCCRGKRRRRRRALSGQRRATAQAKVRATAILDVMRRTLPH